jgi:glycosyltransferase involved in cell wall biosynthesis
MTEIDRRHLKPDAPMVSIIVAAMNARATLQRCIDSVVNQTWPRKELIICDGASSDGTRAIVEYNQNKLAYWCSEPDNGIYDAWNKGLSHSHGDWVCFLGADDVFWSPTVLASAMAQAGKIFPRIRVIYGRVALIAPDGTFLRYLGKPWEESKERFMQVNSLPHPGLLCHRSLFEEHGVFDNSYRISGDYEFLLRELKSGDAHFMGDVITVGMQTGGISSRTKWIRLALKESRRAQRKHGFRYPGPLWIAAYLRALVRSAIASIIGQEKTDKVIDVLRRF